MLPRLERGRGIDSSPPADAAFLFWEPLPQPVGWVFNGSTHAWPPRKATAVSPRRALCPLAFDARRPAVRCAALRCAAPHAGMAPRLFVRPAAARVRARLAAASASIANAASWGCITIELVYTIVHALARSEGK
ncbi:hypothetical protein R5R35_007234 [Gryllus longicercus]|uniref:Uncharacterized protein n=1 Tax=Gryllus longicercus TaxID=2509291 RepID=A0AAN9YVD7_9ORTH